MATEVTDDDTVVPANQTAIEMTQIETMSGGSENTTSEVPLTIDTTPIDGSAQDSSTTNKKHFSTDKGFGHTSLHRACMDSNYDDVVAELLDNKAVDINATDNDGRTPLHYACEGSDKRIVELLILKSADCLTHALQRIDEVPISNDPDVQSKIKQFINCTDDCEDTPLVIACKEGHTEVVKLLLEHGADVNVTDWVKFTPLSIACIKGHTEIVELLLEQDGVDINHTEDDVYVGKKNTPLGLACLKGHTEIVKLLLKQKGVDINHTNKHKNTPLGLACLKGHTKTVELLLKHDGVDIYHANEDKHTPLDLACSQGHTETVELLLNQDVNHTNHNNDTPLSFACLKGHTQLVEMLLKQDGVDVNHTNNNQNTPLGNACLKGHTETVELLLNQKGVDINHTNEDKHTPLGIACKEGRTKVVKLLLDHGAAVTITDIHGNTPLGNACKEGRTKVVKLLLEQDKVDINHTNKDKETPLWLACQKGHARIVEMLLEQDGVDIDSPAGSPGFEDDTPLCIACEEGHTEIVKLLLEHGANVNVTDYLSDTPLGSACHQGHAEIVTLLLEHGVNITKCDFYSKSALDIAVANGHKDAAMAIVKSDKWKEALRSYTDKYESDDAGILGCCKRERNDESDDTRTQFTTPMRRIIEKMPDVAKVVFDRCCKTKKSPYDDDYQITYNYEFLEDFDLKKLYEKWPPKSKYSSQNHCLNILANSPNADLLKHPLVATLLDQKWNKYGRLVYYTNLFFYFLFVILLTSFALTVSPPNSSKCMEILGNDTDTFIGCFSEGRFVYVSIISAFVIVYSTIMLIRELVQVILFRWQYLTSFVNYIEVSLFIFTIMFASVRSNQCYCTHSWQWQFGVIAVFFSWIALVFSIRKLPVVGIYVVMFIKIFNNFIKVVILALLLISAFAVPFYMVFYDPQDRAEGIRTPFITPWRTIIKTVTMTMGEYDMDSILRQDNQRNAPDIQYPVVSFSLIIVFVILMPILFLNLLTGLAVGDADEIRRSADTYSRTLRVEFTLPVEQFLRSIIRQLPKKLKKVKLWIEGLVKVEKKQKIKPNKENKAKEEKKGLTHAISTIQGYFKTELEESVDEVKNKSKPLSQEVKDIRSAVSQEVKDLRSSVSEEVKDLHSSMDQLLAIVKSMNERQGGGGGGRAEGGAGVQEVKEQQQQEEEEQQN